MGKFKDFYLILFCVLLCVFVTAGQIVRAGETFQNNLLKMDVYHGSSGGVKVTLYTNKPYNDYVSVNKKNDFEYVILMPETANSLTAKPTLNAVSDVVKNVEVKTQQYENQVKGYTKIIISTTQPIEIVPQVQTLKTSNYQLSEKDYSELMAQTPKKEANKAVQTVPKSKPAPRPPLLTRANSQVFVQKTIKEPMHAKKIAAEKPVAKKIEAKPKAKIVETKSQVAKPIVQKAEPIVAQTVPEQKTIPTAQNLTGAKVATQAITPQVIAPAIEPTIKPLPPVGRLQRYGIKIKGKIKNIVNNYFGGNIYNAAGLALIPIILLLLILRAAGKTANKIRQQKSDFAKNLKEAPSPVVDYSGKISEDMTWKEKFQTYVEASTPTIEESTKPAEENIFQGTQSKQELDNLFGEGALSEDVADTEKETAEAGVEDEIPQAPPQYEEDSLLDELDEIMVQDYTEEDVSIDELFGEEEFAQEENAETVNIEQETEKPAEFVGEIEEDEFIQSEFVINDETGFYLVDFEDTTALVGHISEEIFVLKRFEEKVAGSLQARLNEKKGNTTNYMTKVGNFKGLVEVTPEKMNLLIEL